MSLLEDIFLGDEASEAQELERIVDGDEFDEERRRDGDDDDDNNTVRGDDEAEEDKRRVDPTKETKTQRVKNPRFVLNPVRLTGPRGIQVIPEHFKDFKFKGKGQEKEDLDLVLKKLEHWAYRLYPKFKFGDCLKKMETLGKKRVVMVTLNKIRNGQYLTEETVVQKDSSDDEQTPVVQEEDEFDKLLQQQIEIARQTPGPNSAKKAGAVGATRAREFGTPFTMPKATSSPSISDEQKERIMRNRRLAEERRLARMKQNSAATNVSNGQFATISEEATSNDTVVDLTGNMARKITDNIIMDLTEMPVETTNVRKKNNRSNIIVSSDEECEVQTTTESVAVDVHESINMGFINRNNQVSEVNEKKDLTDNVETIKDKEVVDIIDNPTVNSGKKHNRSNVIDISDEDCDVQTMNASVTVDVNNSVNGDNDNNNMETVIDNCENEIAEREEIIVSDNNENGIENNNENQTNGPNTEMTEDNTKIEEIQKKQDTETNQKCDDDIKVTRVDDKENIDNNVDPVGIQNTTVEDDVMDVDFTDDF